MPLKFAFVVGDLLRRDGFLERKRSLTHPKQPLPDEIVLEAPAIRYAWQIVETHLVVRLRGGGIGVLLPRRGEFRRHF